MRRSTVGLIVALAFVLVPLIADAQRPVKVPRIGFLTNVIPPTELLEAFRQGLRELGWMEGQNLVVEYRSADGKFDRLPDLAAELVRLNVDIIVAAGTPAPTAAKRATTTTPIVMTNAGDPVGSGLVASLARPGGNVTGLSLLTPDVVGKQLELLKELIPRMTKERVGALLVLADPVFVAHRTRLADLAAKSRLPLISGLREHAEAGGLMTYGASLRDNFRRSAVYIDKIRKGAKPADLPVEQPMKFELVVNLKTTKALGLTIPSSVLMRADRVIQ